MNGSGYSWTLRPEGDHWRWMAVDRDSQAVLTQGLARSRAEAAAFLARAMSLGVLAQREALTA